MSRSASNRLKTPKLRTERLLLRGWRDSDLEPFAALNADPAVMEFMPGLLERAACDAMAGRIRDHFAEHGFGLWAVELPGVAPFIGFVGLSVPRFEAHFMPCVEVVWRLAHAHWGQGHATEAARTAMAFGFEQAGLDEIVSFTAIINSRSQAVMQRLGMAHDPAGNFDHPSLPKEHRLCRHVLYRAGRLDWAEVPSQKSPAVDLGNSAR